MTKLVLVLLLATLPVRAQTPIPAPLQQAAAAVSPDRIREQDKFLSDDLFEGYPGLRGSELAAKYIAAQFALMGLAPAGDNDTYLQQVNFVGVELLALSAAGDGVRAEGGADVFVVGSEEALGDVTEEVAWSLQASHWGFVRRANALDCVL